MIQIAKGNKKEGTDRWNKMKVPVRRKDGVVQRYNKGSSTQDLKIIIAFIKSEMEKVRKEYGEKFIKSYGDPFADVKFQTNKVMEYQHNSDASKGWTTGASRLNLEVSPPRSCWITHFLECPPLETAQSVELFSGLQCVDWPTAPRFDD